MSRGSTEGVLLRIPMFASLAILLISTPSLAQYMYLDANADSVNTSDDRLNESGATNLDVWLDTSSLRDGSPASCPTGEPNTLNSYTFILRALGGTVTWTAFANHQSSMGTSFGMVMDSTDYHNGFGGGTILNPGRFKLASITVSIVSGAPGIAIVESTQLGGSLTTGFGSSCPGIDLDNTLKLGTDWTETDGVAPPNLPPMLNAPAYFSGDVGSYVTVEVSAVDTLSQVAPVIHAGGYPPSLTLSVTQVAPGASRGVLSGTLGMADAGFYNVAWTATDYAGLSSNMNTMMSVTSAEVTEAVIVGYTEFGPGPRSITTGSRGIDAIIGPWGESVYSNPPCGEPMALPVTDFENRLAVDIDVGTGGAVSFTYEVEQTATPFMGCQLDVQLYHGGVVVSNVIEEFGNPAPCWGIPWRSRRLFKTVSLNDYSNQQVTLVFRVGGLNNHGTETQARIYSIAIDRCGEPPLSPLSAEDQLFEIEENHWDETGLTPAMQTALNCLRSSVQAAGGTFDTSKGSAYRTPGYQAHLLEVWEKRERLAHKIASHPECQQLMDYLQLEAGKHGHALKRAPGETSNHSKGLAFDATITGVNMDALAAACNPPLCRYLKYTTPRSEKDCVHFQLLETGRACPPGPGECP